MLGRSIAFGGALILCLCGAALADIPPPKPADPSTSETQAPPTQPADESTPAPNAAQSKEEAEREALAKSLVKRDGVIMLPGGQATVTIADGFAYLDSADADKLLTKIWGNPPGAADNVIGVIMPRDIGPLEAASWAAIITYDNDGHVSDNDAASINYDDLLKQMQTGIEEENEQRAKDGYPRMTLVGWAQKPSYDATGHKLYWAKHLRFGSDNETLNYAIRALGRTGVLQINVIADMRQLPDIDAQIPKLLSMVSFTKGHTYAEFDESTDPIAAYGLAALVAGGVAAKAGLLKWLIAALAASWKLVAAAVVAVGAGIARFFRAIFGGKNTPAS